MLFIVFISIIVFYKEIKGKFKYVILAIVLSYFSCLFTNSFSLNVKEAQSVKLSVIYVGDENGSNIFTYRNIFKFKLKTLRKIKDLKINTKYDIMAKIHSVKYDFNGNNYYLDISDYKENKKIDNYNLFQKISFYLERYKEKISKKVREVYGSEAELVNSLVIGTKSNDLIEKSNNLKELGLIHILSISGFHIALLNDVFKKMRLNKVAVLIIIFYCVLVNSIPGYRLLNTLIILCITKLLKKDSDALNTLLISMSFTIIYKPFYIFNLSFQLTYLSTIGLIALSTDLNKILLEKYKVLYKFPFYIISSISITISTMLFTLPILLFLNNRFSLTSFISNMVLIPIYTIITLLSFIIIITIGVDFTYDILKFKFIILFRLTNFIENIILKFFNFSIPTIFIKESLVIFLVIFIVVLMVNNYSKPKSRIENKKFKALFVNKNFGILLISLISLYYFKLNVWISNPYINYINRYGYEKITVFYKLSVYEYTFLDNLSSNAIDINNNDYINVNGEELKVKINRKNIEFLYRDKSLKFKKDIKKNNTGFSNNKSKAIKRNKYIENEKLENKRNGIINKRYVLKNGKFYRVR